MSLPQGSSILYHIGDKFAAYLVTSIGSIMTRHQSRFPYLNIGEGIMPPPFIPIGPILQRVKPTFVSAWVWLREHCTVKLSLWEVGQFKHQDRAPLIACLDAAMKAVRVSNQLTVVVVSLKLPTSESVQQRSSS
jgi:hypothetical protein